MRIISIVGARPHFVKMAPVSRELRKYFKEIIIHTGQHYDYEMNKIFFDELNLPKPNFNLGIGSGTHGLQTGRMLIKIEEILLKEKPDLVLVYGDTNSTLAGALAPAKLHIPVGHIEAGLRSYDKKLPEELNRILVDNVSDYLFAPTKIAVKNLEKENIRKGVFLVGDVMLDALLENIKIAEKKSKIMEKLGLEPKNYLLATIHRPRNVDNEENLENIIEAFIESEEKIIFPIHPRTRKNLKKFGLINRILKSKNLKIIKSVSYLDMLKLEKNSRKILTDSGGIQKEAYFLRIPCITLRENTEWIETVEDKWNILVGQDKDKILKAIKEFEPSGETYSFKFGDGKASKKIAEIIRRIIKNN